LDFYIYINHVQAHSSDTHKKRNILSMKDDRKGKLDNQIKVWAPQDPLSLP